MATTLPNLASLVTQLVWPASAQTTIIVLCATTQYPFLIAPPAAVTAALSSHMVTTQVKPVRPAKQIACVVLDRCLRTVYYVIILCPS